MRWLALAAVVALIAMVAWPVPASADIYEIKGVEVKAEDEDAAKAKVKAIIQAQEKAFAILVARLVSQSVADNLPEIPTGDISRSMAGMSIEEERTGPKQYIAKLTVRFRPEAVQQLLDQFNVSVTSEQAPSTLLLAVYKVGETAVLWESPNPWRDAWAALSPENSITPVLLPLGDLSDADTLSAEDAIANTEEKIALLKERYNVEHVLVSVAEPSKDGTALSARIIGTSPVGTVNWKDTFKGEAGGDVADVAKIGARRFLAALEGNWRTMGEQRARNAGTKFTMAVPFRSLAEWQTIKSDIEQTMGVTRIDTRTLSGQGAVVDVVYAGPLDQLSADLQMRGLILSNGGDSLVLYRQ